MTELLALSIRQPWAWAILHAGKDIENRSWATQRRGRILIHAGLRADPDVGIDGLLGIAGLNHMTAPFPIPRLADLPMGALVGTAEITDCVQQSPSRWFFGRYGFVLAHPRAFASPIPCKGKLGFFAPALDDAGRAALNREMEAVPA